MQRHPLNNVIDLRNPEHKKKLNEAIFARIAPQYDVIDRILSFGNDYRWKQFLIQQLPLENSAVVLDIATGTGDLIRGIKKRNPAYTLIGCDLSKPMLDHMPPQTRSGCTLMRQDMQFLSVKSSTIDIVTGGYALRNAPDLKRTLLEIHRVLKPGGVAAFLDFSRSPNPLFSAVSVRLLKCWGNFWGFLVHGNPGTYGYIADSLRLFPDRLQFKELVRNSGFEVTGSFIKMFGFIEITLLKKTAAL